MFGFFKKKETVSPWQCAGEKGELGPLVFKAGGSWGFSGGPSFDQGCSLDNCMFGNARVDKEAGEGKELVVRAPDATHAIKYEQGLWYYQRRPTDRLTPRG